MKCIVAVDENWGIGCENSLLFRIPEDLRRLRALTVGNAVILGRKTLFTFPGGKPLKDRANIILSRDPSLHIDGAHTCATPAALFALLQTPAFSHKEAYVLGGAEVYALLLPYCSEALITHVHAAAERADCFFPDLKAVPGWEVAEQSPAMHHDGLAFSYVTYRNSGVLAYERRP